MRLSLLTAVFGLLFASILHAAPITFIHQTLDASGTIDGEIFGTSEVTITATGDTSNIQNQGANVLFIDHISAQIDIEGVGTFNFITATRTFVNQASEIVGFSRAGAGGADLLNDPNNPLFASWDMTTSIGPIDGPMRYLQWGLSPVETDGGILVFNPTTVRGRFEAIVDEAPIVPLPAAGWMLIAGIGGLGLMRKRKS